MTQWIRTAAIPLLCACMASRAPAEILPTDLEARVGANYQPGDADEREIWQRLQQVEETIRTSPQRLIAPDLDAYTRRVVERLIGRPAPDLRIYLMRDASFNAAMLPSGMMIVNTGLLVRVRNEAQFAAVLGHEAGHYFRRHSLERYRDIRQKSEGSAAVAAAGGMTGIGSRVIDPSWSLIYQAALMSVFKFSRGQESEADAYGLMLMARAGYPPRAAFSMWEQLVDERRASAAARDRPYRDGTRSAASTHPPTEGRIINLTDTADHLAGTDELTGGEGRDEWRAATGPYLAMLLREQVNLNDPGASLYLLENLAQHGWTGLLRFNEGEVYRLRNAAGDDEKAASAYAAATALADAPPEAWRAHGYALLKAGRQAEAYEALNRYLAMKPGAPDAAMIGFTLAAADGSEVAGSHLSLNPGSNWKRLPAGMSQSRWEEVWSRNGPQLDRMALIDGLPEGKAIISQDKNADQRVPVFRADMTAQDFMSMVEVSYRVNGVVVFDFESVEPIDFLGGRGVRLRYRYASGVGFSKRGSCVMRVVDEKLYAMKLEGVANDSFDAVATQFDQLVDSARWRNPARSSSSR